MTKTKAVMSDHEDRYQGNLCFSDRRRDHAGVTLAYALTPDDQEYEILHCAYSFEWVVQPNYQTRAFRQDRRLRGLRNKPLPAAALRDELIVAPGAGMTAENVIYSLEKMICAIRSQGLIIGKTSKDCFCAERIGGEPRWVNFDDPKTPIEAT